MDGRWGGGHGKQKQNMEGEWKLGDRAAARLGPSQLPVAKYTGHSSQPRWVRVCPVAPSHNPTQPISLRCMQTYQQLR